MYGLVLPPYHPCPIDIDVPYAYAEFPLALPHMVYGTKVLNVTQGHVVPQNFRQARSLPGADKYVTADHEEMRSIADTM